MPAEYNIDTSLRIVFSAAHGTITDHDAFSHQDNLRNEVGFDPGFSQFFDFTKVTKVELSTEAIHRLAERNLFGLGSKRAFVVSSDLMYGLSRMFQVLITDYQDELTVFRDIHEARRYLSLEE